MVNCGSWSDVLCELNKTPGGRTVLKISTAWCGPCRTLQKILEGIEGTVDNVKFICVDADEVDDDFILEKFNVKGVPALIVLDENGETISQTVGLQTKEEILERLKS